MKNVFIKLFFILLFITFILFSSSLASSYKVFAVTSRETITDEDYSYDYCERQAVDSSVDYYTYKYRIYNYSGMHQGTFNIPKNIVDGDSHYFCYMRSDNTIALLVSAEKDNFHLVYKAMSYNKYFMQTTYSGDMHSVEYRYNSDSNSFTLHYDGTAGVRWGWEVESVNYFPSSVLLSNCDIRIYPRGIQNEYISYLYVRDNLVLKTPILKQKVGYGFRLYLCDYYDREEIRTDITTLQTVLTNLNLYVYDFVTGEYRVQAVDVLTNSTIEEDSEGNYYIDINENICNFVYSRDGDYLVSFISILNSSVHYSNLYSGRKNYNDLSYFRYKYNASSGTGLLIPTDEDR